MRKAKTELFENIDLMAREWMPFRLRLQNTSVCFIMKSACSKSHVFCVVRWKPWFENASCPRKSFWKRTEHEGTHRISTLSTPYKSLYKLYSIPNIPRFNPYRDSSLWARWGDIISFIICFNVMDDVIKSKTNQMGWRNMICIKMSYQAGDEMKTHRERNPGKSRMIKTVD